MEIVSSLRQDYETQAYLVEDDDERRYVVKNTGGIHTCSCVDECGCAHIQYVEGQEEETEE